MRSDTGPDRPAVLGGADHWVVAQLRRVGAADPTSRYVVVTVEPPAVDVTVTMPGTPVPVATSSRTESQYGLGVTSGEYPTRA